MPTDDNTPKLTIGQRKTLKAIIQNHPLVRSDLAKDREILLKECGVAEIRGEMDCKAEPSAFATRLVSELENGIGRRGLPLLPVFLAHFVEQYGETVKDPEKRQALIGMAGDQPREIEMSQNSGTSTPSTKDPQQLTSAEDQKQDPKGDKRTQFLIAFIREAVQAVPAVKWAVGVGGIAAVVALISTPVFGLPPKLAAVGVSVMLVLMVLLVIFAQAAKFKKDLVAPAKVFTWFCLFLFMAASSLLLTSAFFDWPRPLSQLLG